MPTTILYFFWTGFTDQALADADPEETFVATARGNVFESELRGNVFGTTQRGNVFAAEDR